MQKTAALKVLNPVLALLAATQVLSAFLHDLLPPQAFQVLHQGGGVLLAACIALHVTLNWSWVRASYLKKAGAKDRPEPSRPAPGA